MNGVHGSQLRQNLYTNRNLLEWMGENKLDPTFQPELIGREDEFGQLMECWKDVLDGEGSTILISGEAGIGKTRLVTELLELARTYDTLTVKGWCLADALDPLMPFREALRDAGLYHLMAERPPPKVISAYLMDDSGIMITKAELQETELDPDVFSSMLNAVDNFVSDSLSMMGEDGGKKLNAIGYGGYDILIQTKGDLSLTVVIDGISSEFLIEDMNKTLSSIDRLMDDTHGTSDHMGSVKKEIEWYVTSGKYEGKYLVDDPKLKQENLFDNILLGLRRLSLEQPLVLFLDDLQWADPTSLRLLHYLSRNTVKDRILILGAYRPEDILDHDVNTEPVSIYGTHAVKSEVRPHPFKTTKQNMSRENLFREITLDRLNEETVTKMISRIFGDKDFDHEFVKTIYHESEGNPFFLIELTRLLVEEGHIWYENGDWKTEATHQEVHIPSKIYDVIVRRLNRLDNEQRDLLECASVIGEEFESAVVERVTGTNRMKLLKDFNHIEKTHNIIHYVNKRYRFDHSKIREILYTGINQELREEYHRMVGECYLDLYGDEYVEAIANHLYRADDPRAGDHLVKAGTRSKDNYFNQEAFDHYVKALSFVDDEETLLKIYRDLGYLTLVFGRYEGSLEYLEKALDVASDRDDKSEIYGQMAMVYEEKGDYQESLRIGKIGLSMAGENSISRCHLLKSIGWALLRMGDYDGSISNFKDELELANKLGSKAENAQAFHDIGTVYLRKGDYDKAEEYLQQAIELREELGDLGGLGVSLNNIGVIYHGKGDLDRSLEYYLRSLKIREEIGYKQGIAMNLNNIGNYYRYKGNLEEGLDYYQRSLDIKESIGDKEGIAMTLNNMGKIYYENGDTGKALEYYMSSLRIREDIKDKDGIVECLCMIGEINLDRSDLDQAASKAANALRMAVEIGSKKDMGISYRVLGMVHRTMGKYAASEVALTNAVNVLQDIGEKAKLARAFYERGLLWKAQGDPEKAEADLSVALDLFQEMGMESWVERTREQL